MSTAVQSTIGARALISTLAIVVWHVYSTVFSPHVYPMNPAWLTGKMPKDMYALEHQDGPRLKSRVHRVLIDEEEEEPIPLTVAELESGDVGQKSDRPTTVGAPRKSGNYK